MRWREMAESGGRVTGDSVQKSGNMGGDSQATANPGWLEKEDPGPSLGLRLVTGETGDPMMSGA